MRIKSKETLRSPRLCVALHKNSKNSGVNYQSCSLLAVRYWLIVSDLLNISEQLEAESEQPEADF